MLLLIVNVNYEVNSFLILTISVQGNRLSTASFWTIFSGFPAFVIPIKEPPSHSQNDNIVFLLRTTETTSLSKSNLFSNKRWHFPRNLVHANGCRPIEISFRVKLDPNL